MFEKFGEFDSAQELNRAAEAQKNEGDAEAVKALARENGLDPEDAEDYLDGYTDTLATVTSAAVGKLDREAGDLELEGMLADWKDMLAGWCMENYTLAAAVRRKGKSLAGYIAALIAFSFENKVQVSGKITDITMVEHNGKKEKIQTPLYMGVPGRTQAKKLAYEYYTGETEK